MIEINAPAGSSQYEKMRIDDLTGDLRALDDQLESLGESADAASAELSGDRRGATRLLSVWASVTIIGTIVIGFVADSDSMFPRLPLSMFAGLLLGFLIAAPAIRRDKSRMNKIAEAAMDVAGRAEKTREELTSIIFAPGHFAPDDSEWVSVHHEKARNYGQDLAASVRTSIHDRAWPSRARISPVLLTALLGVTVTTGLVASPDGVPSWWASALCVTIVVLGLLFVLASEASASVRGQTRQDFVAKNVAANEARWLTRLTAAVNRSSIKVASSDDNCEIDHDQRCCSIHDTHTMPHRGCILR